MTTNPNTHRIVVLGAGYAGLLATVRLVYRTRKQDVRIVLVNPTPRFTERLRMHQIAAGQELPNHHIPDLLAGTDVEFVAAAATAVDPRARTVALTDGTELGYDTLVYALGSTTDTTTVPGVADHAWTLNDPRAARRFAGRLAEVDAAGGSVTVVGGGLTGVEAATEIAEAHPGLTVTLIATEEPGSMMGDKARAHLTAALDRLGIVRRIGVHVTKVLPDGVDLADGTTEACDLVLWTAGVRMSPLAAAAGIVTDERGAIRTDPTLRSVSHPEIYAIGDAAVIEQAWGTVHGTCQSGIPSAAYAADTIARRLRGKPVRPFRFGYVHQPVSLGRRDAVIQFTKADDTPKRWYLAGRAAIAYKEMVSNSPLPAFKYSARMPMPVALSKGGRATR